MCVHVGSYTHIYVSLLGQLTEPRSKDTSAAISTSSTQILVSKAILQ